LHSARGRPADSPLIKRKLANLERGTFASPDYIRHRGILISPHRVVQFDC